MIKANCVITWQGQLGKMRKAYGKLKNCRTLIESNVRGREEQWERVSAA